MSKGTSMRTTVYFEPDLHKALRLKAAHSHQSVSDIVNEAVRQALREDQEDLETFESRVAKPTISYETLLEETATSPRAKTIQVTLEASLLDAVDKLSSDRNTTRAEWIGEVLETELQREQTAADERRHAEGYANHPVQPGEFDVWFDEQVDVSFDGQDWSAS